MARAKRQKHRRYYALVVPGIEDMASAELRRAGASDIEILSRFDKRDSIVLFVAPDADQLLRCALIEDVFSLLVDAPLPHGRAAPSALARGIERLALEAALLEHHALSAKKRGRSYKVVARAAGRHPFRRDEVEASFGRVLGALLPHWVAVRVDAAIELWVHIIGARAIGGLRLSGDELAQRRYKRAHVPASLKPTIARALVDLSQPRPDDVFIDPMCGAGTILRERADARSARRIVGGDADRSAIVAARENVGRTPELAVWDATRLPVQTGSVDAIVVNPPYGRQHGESGGVERLYRRTMLEAKRVLRPGGRCVVLTSEADVLRQALPRELRLREKRRLLVRGLPVTAFVMVRA